MGGPVQPVVHRYRIKCATEYLPLESNPLAYVATLAGWKAKDMKRGQADVMVSVYQRPTLDPERMIKVLGNRGTLRRPEA